MLQEFMIGKRQGFLSQTTNVLISLTGTNLCKVMDTDTPIHYYVLTIDNSE